MREHFDFSARLRNKIKREKLVMVNGISTPGWKKPNVGDVIKITLPDETSGFEPQNIPLNIVYEDDDIIVVNKKSGMVVHPGNGNHEHTLVNALMGHTDDLSDEGGSERCGIVHRIDKDTSGILLVAKTNVSLPIF